VLTTLLSVAALMASHARFRWPRASVWDGVNGIVLSLEDGTPVTVRYWDLVLPKNR
jgi:hypothetical protein